MPTSGVQGRPLPALSALQLAFELVQKAPVGPLGDDLVGARFDHAGVAQPKRIEAYRVLGVIAAPFRVWDFPHSLKRIVVWIASVRDDTRGPFRRRRAQVHCLEQGPQRSLGGYRVLAHELAMAGDQAAEVLRPRPVD